jgi:predicted DNA-binding transcriptional regulator AlpA
MKESRHLRLKDIAPRMATTVGGCYKLLERGRFPIRHVQARPYRFTEQDVEQWLTHGISTNPGHGDGRRTPSTSWMHRRGGFRRSA